MDPIRTEGDQLVRSMATAIREYLLDCAEGTPPTREVNQALDCAVVLSEWGVEVDHE